MTISLQITLRTVIFVGLVWGLYQGVTAYGLYNWLFAVSDTSSGPTTQFLEPIFRYSFVFAALLSGYILADLRDNFRALLISQTISGMVAVATLVGFLAQNTPWAFAGFYVLIYYSPSFVFFFFLSLVASGFGAYAGEWMQIVLPYSMDGRLVAVGLGLNLSAALLPIVLLYPNWVLFLMIPLVALSCVLCLVAPTRIHLLVPRLTGVILLANAVATVLTANSIIAGNGVYSSCALTHCPQEQNLLGIAETLDATAVAPAVVFLSLIFPRHWKESAIDNHVQQPNMNLSVDYNLKDLYAQDFETAL